MPSFWNSLVLNGPVPALVWPIDFALSIACLKPSGVLMSRFTPPALMASNSGYRIPATQLYVIINSSLRPEFHVVERTTPSILTQSVSTAIEADLRLLLDRTFVAAKNSGIGFNAATIPASFNVPSRGAFDPVYMKALFDAGFQQGKSEEPFAAAPPPPPGVPAAQSNDPPQSSGPQPGANK